MTKTEFLDSLKSLISEYPDEETVKSLEYYEEMIDDRMEDGMSEAEAIASLGKPENIAEQIKCELPLMTLVKQKAKETKGDKQTPWWSIVLIIVCAPVWIPISISIISVICSFLLGIWSLVFAMWLIDIAMVVVAVVGIAGFILMIIKGSILSAIIYFGLALAVAGIAIFLFIACVLVTKGLGAGMIWMFRQIKKSLVGKKEA